MARRTWISSLLVLALIVPTMGAAAVALQAARDLTANDAALQAVTDANTAWGATVDASDAARATYDQALQDLQTSLAAEGAARADLEQKQSDYSDAYGAVPKEDTLAPAP